MATDVGLLILRIVIGLTFAAHGAQKVFGWWGGPGLSGWTGAMHHMRIRPARFWAVVSAGAELLGGLLIAVGLFTPFATAALIGQSIVIIGHAHWAQGFWNGKNGIEFPLTLAAGVLAIALVGPGAIALDAAFGLSFPDPLRAALIVLAVIGGVAAWALPRIGASSGNSAAQPR